MKALLLLLLSALFCFIFAQNMIWVDGYTRSDGTYVAGHYRTAPDNSTYNNYGGDYNKPAGDARYDDNNSSSSSSSSSSYSTSRGWVNGYYRSDGTYVQGHYRRR